jgi:hypothetical protein
MFEDKEFDRDLAEGTPSAESIVMLLGVDPNTLDRADAIAATIGLERAKRLLDAVQVTTMARAAGKTPAEPGGGLDEVTSEMSAALNMHPHTAAMQVHTARDLVGRLLTTWKRLEAGELGYQQAELVTRMLRGLHITDAQQIEQAAVPGNPRRLLQRLVREIARVAPDHLRKKAEQHRTARTVENWSDPAEGVAGFTVQGPTDLVAQIKAAVDAEARQRVAGECRSLAARRFDVLLGWARHASGLPADEPTTGTAPAAPGRCSSCGRAASKVSVAVTVPLATLLHLSEAPGQLDGYGPIPADAARALAADGEWHRWLTEPTGRLTDTGHRTYRPSAALDRYIRGRDRTCRFPTCNQPAARCDLDHTLAFHTENGDTTPDNLVALCRRHHRLKHETDWTYTATPTGHVTWTAPSGRTYTQAPEYYDDEYLSNPIPPADNHPTDPVTECPF